MVDLYRQFKDFKSFEVSFFNKNNELQKLVCTVKSIENNNLHLSANNKDNKNITANVGDELKLHIYTDNGIYSASSKVVLVTPGVVNTEYIISYPANSKHSQRREFFRAEMSIDFEIKISSEEEQKAIEGKTKNICGKGMSFVSSAPFLDNGSVSIKLKFQEQEIETKAVLVYSKQIMLNESPKFIHALTFTSISQKNIDFIVKKCFLHQLDLKKRMV